MRRWTRTLVAAAAAAVVLTLLPPAAVQAVRVPETLSHRAPVGAAPVVPGFAVDYLGVLWDDAGAGHAHADVSAAVRLRHDGSWGEWIPLVEDGASGPGLWASGLVAGEGAEAFQVRGAPAAVGARTVALNTTEGPLRATGAVVRGAAAVDSCLSRAEWGADETIRDWDPAFSDAQVLTLHHTATRNDDPDPAATVRAIYAYHTIDNGWGDIGYQYLVDESGRVYEGRWSGATSQPCSAGGTGADFGHEAADGDADVVTGGHAYSYNTGNLGIALLGDFRTDPRYGAEPQPEAVAAAVDLMTELSVRHGFDPLGRVHYVNPVSLTEADVATISGHRDLTATECPGDRLYDDMASIRAAVAAATTPPDDPSGDDDTQTVRVSDLDGSSTGLRGTWTATVTATVVTGAAPAGGATLTGTWDGEDAACTTDGTGQCTLELAGLRKRQSSVTFTVTGISLEGFTYDASANSDPDGDSDGTTLVVAKP